jgi:hypothetical protein
MLMAPPVTTKQEYLERFAQTWKILRVGSFPEDEALDRTRAERNFERGLNPAGVGRQLRAILASGSRKQRLGSVKAPIPWCVPRAARIPRPRSPARSF